MGLDMHLFKLEKPEKSSEELSAMSLDELNSAGYTVFFQNELPDDFHLICCMAKRAAVMAEYIDLEKIREDYEIPAGSRIIGESYSSQEIGYTFRLPKAEPCDQKHIDIPMDQVRAKYVYKKKTDAYCIKSEEIAYWRKRYDIQSALYDAAEVPIQNCGYYPMTDDMWDALRKWDKETYNRLAHYKYDNSCIIVYHEWY